MLDGDVAPYAIVDFLDTDDLVIGKSECSLDVFSQTLPRLTANSVKAWMREVSPRAAIASPSTSSAARTNLSSQDVSISDEVLGEGTFRTAYRDTYVGGNRNGQAAACKEFKPEHDDMKDEYFADDFRVADRVIEFAEGWNNLCKDSNLAGQPSDSKKCIQITKGDVKEYDYGETYLVEPLIREYTKFTSNSGWIAPRNNDAVKAMEAF